MARQQATVQLGFTEKQWEANLQANLKNDDLIDDSDISFEGSYLAGTAVNQWLIAGQIPTWWGRAMTVVLFEVMPASCSWCYYAT